MTPETFGTLVLELIDAATFPGKARHNVMAMSAVAERLARGEIVFTERESNDRKTDQA